MRVSWKVWPAGPAGKVGSYFILLRGAVAIVGIFDPRDVHVFMAGLKLAAVDGLAIVAVA